MDKTKVPKQIMEIFQTLSTSQGFLHTTEELCELYEKNIINKSCNPPYSHTDNNHTLSGYDVCRRIFYENADSKKIKGKPRLVWLKEEFRKHWELEKKNNRMIYWDKIASQENAKSNQKHNNNYLIETVTISRT